MSAVHIAAKHVVIDERWMRQRCAWCGLVLADYDITTMGSIDGSPPGMWAAGALVEVDGNHSAVVPGVELPVNCCAIKELGG